MANKYGRSALSASIVAPDMSKYLAKIQQAGKDVDTACIKAVNAALPIIEKSMKEGAARHRKGRGRYGTDAVYDAIEIQDATSKGNFISGTVGIDMKKHPEAIDGVYQEYGDGHSPEFPDPFVRPAVDDNRKQILSIERQVLKKEGIPIE